MPMPELPEVETIRRGLMPVMEGQRIVSAEVNRPDLRFPLPEHMAVRLAGVTVRTLRRRSKYLLADLDSGETLLIHLGMSGRILISGQSIGSFHRDHPAPQKHDHVVLHMDHGLRVTFNDARRFGAMDLMPTATAQDHALLVRLGPEPLGNDFHESYLARRLAGRLTPIKSALLDQRIIAGLGNIYVCEVLFRAKIHPARATADTVAAPLVPVIREVLAEAIEAGGSSLKDYRQTDGELGYFQHRFQVYDRAGEPCLSCGTPIQRLVQSGRSSFYCPSCQR
jgi:formamidopyrimidine-DNA glycosylase